MAASGSKAAAEWTSAWAIGAGGWTSVVASAIEHDSVLAAIRAGAADHVAVPATRDGVVDLAALEALLRDSGPPARTLLTLQTANNETGVLQPVAEASAIARAHGVRVHTDAVQAAGRVAIDWQGSGVDALSLSAHKLGGPKGVGALVLSERLALRALIPGSQERRRRGGTENVVGICGFGAAARAALADLADAPRIAGLRDRLEAGVIEARPGTEVIGRSVPRLPNTSLIACPGERAETAVIRLDLAGLSVSAGAACSSGKVGASHVLAAMGLPPELARAASGALRSMMRLLVRSQSGAWALLARSIDSARSPQSRRRRSISHCGWSKRF